MAADSKDDYRTIAPWYDTLFEPLNRKLKRIALRFAPLDEGETVLDVGCGTGAMLEYCAEAGCEIWGLDMSAAMLDVARRRFGDRAHLHHGDATAMPFDDAQFDWVIFSFVLHEMALDTRMGVLAEAKRVLRSGGRILVVEYHAARVPLRGWPLKVFLTATERIAGGEHWAGYRHFIRHGAMDGLAPEAGLVIDKQKVVADGNLAVSVLKAG